MARLQDVLIRGTVAAQPAANSVAVGTLYCQTDGSPNFRLQRSNGTTWEDYAPTAGGGGGGGVALSAGTQSVSTGTVVFSNSNGVTFGMSGSSRITASVASSLTNVNVSAGTTSNNLSAVTFSNSNGVSFGLNASTITATVKTDYAGTGFTSAGANISLSGTQNSAGLSLSASVAPPSAASINVSAGTTSNNLSALTFSNANGVSFGLNASTITATVKTDYLTTAALSGDTTKYVQAWELTGNTSGTTSSLQGTKLYFSGGNSLTVSGSSNTIVLSVGNYLTTAALSQDSSKYAGTGFTSAGNNIGLSGTLDTAGLSLSATVAAQTNQTVGLYLSSNTTSSVSSGTQDARSLTFRGMGIASLGYSNGEVIVSVPSGGGGLTNINVSAGTTSQNLSNLVFSDSNRQSWGLSGSTITGKHALNVSAGTTSNDISDQIVFSNSNNVSFGLNGSTITASAGPIISSYENTPLSNATMTVNDSRSLIAVAFYLPEPISASFIRMPVLMTTNSTTLATTSSAIPLSASVVIYSSYSAVIYSLGTGASSKSLLSVTSGSGGFTQLNSISVQSSTNNTQYTVGQQYTFEVEGSTSSTSQSYGASQTNFSFVTTGWHTLFSSRRYLDYEFAASLPAGNYWLLHGTNTSSTTGPAVGLNISNASNCNVRYSAHYGGGVPQSHWGVMGQANLTSGGLEGFGFFSTNGGTQTGFDISVISSLTVSGKPYFQMLRSA